MPGLAEVVQRDHRIIMAGPTNLAALLNSLQIGFRTLIIEKRSSEVWKLLGAVKTEFGKFGDLLEKTQTKLEQASKEIGNAKSKSRTIERKLGTIQELPEAESAKLLGDGNDRILIFILPVVETRHALSLRFRRPSFTFSPSNLFFHSLSPIPLDQ